MAFTHVFAGIFVADRDRAAGWYERVIGRPPDLVPNEHEAAWRLSQDGWLCLIADAQRAGGALHTVLLDELEPFLGELDERGVEYGEAAALGGSMRQVIVVDPDGNRLKVAAPAQ